MEHKSVRIHVLWVTFAAAAFAVFLAYTNIGPAGTDPSGAGKGRVVFPSATAGPYSGFSNDEVAAAQRVVEEYFRAIAEKDSEAVLQTLSTKPEASHKIYFGSEKLTLKKLTYRDNDPLRYDYTVYGRGSVNKTKLENVIVFRVSYTVKYPMGASGPMSNADGWAMILIRTDKNSPWLIDDQGY